MKQAISQSKGSMRRLLQEQREPKTLQEAFFDSEAAKAVPVEREVCCRSEAQYLATAIIKVNCH